MRWIFLFLCIYCSSVFCSDFRSLNDIFQKDYADFNLALPSSSHYVIEKIDFAQCPSFYVFGDKKKVEYLKKTLGKEAADPKDTFIAFFPHELDEKTSQNISQLVDVIGIQLQSLGGEVAREKAMCGKYPVHLFTLKTKEQDGTYLSHIALIDFSPKKFCLQMNFSCRENTGDPLLEVWNRLIKESK